VAGERLADYLYEWYRNTLLHSFGIDLQWPKGATVWTIEKLSGVTIVARTGRDGLIEAQVDELEISDQCSAWLTLPTLVDDHRNLVLIAEPRYWGTRQLARRPSVTSPYAHARADRHTRRSRTSVRSWAEARV
jgi:hypothetical protein